MVTGQSVWLQEAVGFRLSDLNIQEQILTMEGYLNGRGGQGFTGRQSLLEQTCHQLLGIVCHQTALYCSKLLQVGKWVSVCLCICL